MYNIKGEEFSPRRATIGSAGYDFIATEDMTIQPYPQVFDTFVKFDGTETIKFDTFGVTDNWLAILLPRSSMGFKHGLKFENTMAVIDKDYRDTIKVSLTANHSFTINKGERYAQMIFVPFGIDCTEIIPMRKRDGGLGSTGV